MLQKIASDGKQNQNADIDYTLGIYQSIGEYKLSHAIDHCRNVNTGYREFNGYLTSGKPSESTFAEALERMKISTRQYAKRQISWLKNKLLPAMYAANEESGVSNYPYLLDATGLQLRFTILLLER